jgi:outer membrane protein, heavy metal efflux system
MPLLGLSRFRLGSSKGDMPVRQNTRILAVSIAGALLWTTGCVHYQNKPLNAEAAAAVLDQRSLDDVNLRDFLQRNTLLAEATAWPLQSWEFETLSWVAFYYHPSLELARAQWTAMVAGQTTASARPNPALSLTPGYNANAAGSSPWFPAVGIDLPVETAGKRQRRIEQVRHSAESARQMVFSAAWQVRSDLRRTLVMWTHARQRAAILKIQANADKRIVDLVENRRAAGAASAMDAATVRLAWTRSEADAAEAQHQTVLALSGVAQALGVPVSGLGPLAVTDALARPNLRSDGELAAARSLALRSRPDILAALADYEAAQSTLRLEIARQYPDLHLGPGYQWDQGASKWSLALTAELPLFNRNAGPIAAAEARRRESAARFTVLQAQIAGAIDQAVVALAAAEARAVSIQRVAESLDLQLGIQQARLQAGDIDQLDYQIARRELSAAELSALDARAAAALAAAELEAALQVPFARLTSLAETIHSPALPSSL